MSDKKAWNSSVDYSESIVEIVPVTGEGCRGSRGKVIGKKRMRCKVEVQIDLDAIIRVMGAKAASSKTGKSQDGFVTVKRIGAPVEVFRELYPVKETP